MSEYNADSIKVLSDIEHIQTRPGMYVGECIHPGHLFSEIYDNALDELQNGYGTKVIVEVDTQKNEYTVIDDGRGIPIGEKELPDGTKKSVLVVLFTKANSGGKFDNEAFKIRAGLHGVGSTVVNALSSELYAKSIRDNLIESVKFDDGEVSDHRLIEDTESHSHGTTIKFIPNPKFFQSVKIPKQFIINRCRVASALGMKTELTIDGEVIDTDSTMYDLINMDEDATVYTRTQFRVDDKDTGEFVEVAMLYDSSESAGFHGYTNLLPNPNGGTHFKMMDDALIRALDSYGLDGVTVKDYYLGLRLVVAVFISDPSFSSQTKEKLTVDRKKLEKFVPMISSEIRNWLDSDPELRDGIFNRMKAHRAQLNKFLSKRDLSKLVVVNNDKSGSIRRKSVVTKLIECTNQSREGTELYLVEGDSASGSFLPVRDRKTQAILPLRGKILNVSKLDDIITALKNSEILDIVNAVGANLLEESDPTASRYDKIILAADSDPDGDHISALLIGLVVNLLPNLVKAGMLYMVKPALYSWRDKSGLHFTNDITDIPNGCEVQRFKGLGEMDPEEVKICLTDPETRILYQIHYPESLEVMNSMLTSSSTRKRMLEDLGLIKWSE